MSLQHMEPGFDHHEDVGTKEEKKSESSTGVVHENRCEQEIVVEVDELEKAKSEMGGVREENQRLKMSLNKILNEYHKLQTQFNNMAEQENKNSPDRENKKNQEINEDSDLISLSLGRLPCNPKVKVSKPLKEEEDLLSLGLECKFETSKSESTTEPLPNLTPGNSSEAPKEEASKVSRNIRITREDEVLSQQNPTKKTRVCVRARCDTPTLNDGCQWRKYGQKISKGNPCPRAYYRCTVATSCPVRKQVQRCAQDMSILITTYEGNHNHPLPPSATAMASTTSAAASVLLSGSSTSSHSRTTPSPISLNSSNNGMNFYLSNSSKSNQLYISPPSLSSHPTITLDLTSNPPSSSSSSSPFRRFATSSNSNYPSTSLNFSSSESNAMSWSNNGFLNSHSQPYNNRNNILSTMKLGTLAMENNIYYSYMQRNNNNNNNNNNIFQIPSSSQYSLQDQTIAAATKAITTDPNFQSALAAALTSVIGTGNKGVGEK